MITRVKIKNFGVHKYMDIELEKGINGIIGTNGSGKSTILEAIRFGFTGQVSMSGNKDDNVSWGEDRGSVEIWFTYGDTDYQLKRTLGAGSSQRLITPEDTYRRKTEIEQYLRELLGASADALLNNIFPPQGDIDKILFDTRTQRLKEMQQTVGLQRAAEAEKALGNEINSYILTIGLDAQIEAIEEEFEKVDEELKDATRHKSSVDDEIDCLETYRDKLNEFMISQENRVILDDTKKEIDGLERELYKSNHERLEISSHIEAMAYLRDSKKPLVEDAQEKLLDIRSREKQIKTVESLKEKLVKIDKAIVDLTESRDDLLDIIESKEDLLRKKRSKLDQLVDIEKEKIPYPETEEEKEYKEEYQNIAAELDDLTKKELFSEELDDLQKKLEGRNLMLESIDEGSCYACGAPVDDVKRAFVENEIEELEGSISEVSKALRAERDEKVRELTEYLSGLEKKIEYYIKTAREVISSRRKKIEKEVEELENDLKMLRSEKETLGELRAKKTAVEEQISNNEVVESHDVDIDELKSTVDKYDKVLTKLSDLESELKLKEQKIENIESSLQRANERKEKIESSTVSFSDEEIAEAKEKVDVLAERLNFRKSLIEALTGLEVKYKEYSSSLKSLHEKYEREKKDQEWVKFCKKVRDVFHVSALPSLAMREYATVLNKRVDYYLSTWEAHFTMELDEELSFIAKFDDRIHPAKRLSGGQRIIASTSFRLAMGDTFAKRVGLLVLDEPSVYLDKDNIIHLQRLLLKLKELAGATGKQILLVTHEETLSGFFDNIIRL